MRVPRADEKVSSSEGIVDQIYRPHPQSYAFQCAKTVLSNKMFGCETMPNTRENRNECKKHGSF